MAGTFKLGGSAAPKLSWDGATLKIIGTLQTTNIEAGSSLTVLGTIIAGGGGVKISTTGINIFGLGNALTTRATEAGAIQCYVGADGKFYAGAGAIALSSSGIIITGSAGSAWLTLQGNMNTGFLTFKDTSNNHTCTMNMAGDYFLVHTPTGGGINLDVTGADALLAYGIRLGARYMALPSYSSDPSSTECYCYYNTSTHRIKYYDGTAWRSVAYV